MTFAAWEKMIRMLHPYQTIQTELGYGGEVVLAWSWGGQVWRKAKEK